jgi:hypothetical protein
MFAVQQSRSHLCINFVHKFDSSPPSILLPKINSTTLFLLLRSVLLSEYVPSPLLSSPLSSVFPLVVCSLLSHLFALSSVSSVFSLFVGPFICLICLLSHLSSLSFVYLSYFSSICPLICFIGLLLFCRPSHLFYLSSLSSIFALICFTCLLCHLFALSSVLSIFPFICLPGLFPFALRFLPDALQ